jgi:Protein of unknown function (DUF3592)
MSRGRSQPPDVQRGFKAAAPSLVLAVPALAACVWLLWVGLENLRSGSWPRAEGTVDSIRVYQKVGSRGGVQHTAEVRYTFTVDGAAYHGDRFNTRGDYLAGIEAADAVTRTYRPGGPCEVAYDPSDPARCFLDTGVTWHTWGKLAIGAAAGLAGLALLYHGFVGWFRGRIVRA